MDEREGLPLYLGSDHEHGTAGDGRRRCDAQAPHDVQPALSWDQPGITYGRTRSCAGASDGWVELPGFGRDQTSGGARGPREEVAARARGMTRDGREGRRSRASERRRCAPGSDGASNDWSVRQITQCSWWCAEEQGGASSDSTWTDACASSAWTSRRASAIGPSPTTRRWKSRVRNAERRLQGDSVPTFKLIGVQGSRIKSRRSGWPRQDVSAGTTCQLRSIRASE